MNEGKRIKERRKELNLSQTELGKRLGISKGAVSNVETGKERLTMDRLARYAIALSTTVEQLIGSGASHYVDMLCRSLGYAMDGEKENGYMWIEHNGVNYDITEKEWNTFITEIVNYTRYKLYELTERRREK